MLYIRPLEFIHFITQSLQPLVSISSFPHFLLLVATILLCYYEFDSYFSFFLRFYTWDQYYLITLTLVIFSLSPLIIPLSPLLPPSSSLSLSSPPLFLTLWTTHQAILDDLICWIYLSSPPLFICWNRFSHWRQNASACMSTFVTILVGIMANH